MYDMNPDKSRIWLLITCVFLILIIGLGQYRSLKLEAEFDTALLVIEGLKGQVADLEVVRDNLVSQLESLETDSQKLSDSYSELSGSYEDLSGNVQDTIDIIDSYEKELQTSMDWFQINSNLDALEKKNFIRDYLENACVEFRSDECRIKTGCLYFINSEKLDVKYHNDEDLVGKVDSLQSLDDFYANKGGDCEDYALFYKAEINHLLDLCAEEGLDNIVFDAWYVEEDSRDKYWLDYDKNWFLDNVSSTLFEDGHKYPNVVCGNMYDLNRDEVNGHCVIAFTKTLIEDENMISYLDDAILIEPQNGLYMGNINRDSSNVLLANHVNSDILTNTDSYIYELITDSDLFLFSFEENRWLSYLGLFTELHDKKIELFYSIK